jgi:hypothetical protein
MDDLKNGGTGQCGAKIELFLISLKKIKYFYRSE